MKKSRLIILGILLQASFLGLFAQTSSSEPNLKAGPAGVGAYGVLPVKGLYGASNSWPINSYVEIENLENGKKVKITIVDNLENSSMLVLLSQLAADTLSISSGSIVDVRGIDAEKEDLPIENLAEEQAFHPDPDVNPSATEMDEGLSSENTDELLAMSRFPVETSDPVEETDPVIENPVVQPPEVTEEEPEIVELVEVVEEVLEEPEIVEDIEVVEDPEVLEEPIEEPEVVEIVPVEIEPVIIAPPVEEKIIAVDGHWSRPEYEEEDVTYLVDLPSEPVIIIKVDEREEVTLLDKGVELYYPNIGSGETLSSFAVPSEPLLVVDYAKAAGPVLLGIDAMSIAEAPMDGGSPDIRDFPVVPKPIEEEVALEDSRPEAFNGYRLPELEVLDDLAMILPEVPVREEASDEVFLVEKPTTWEGWLEAPSIPEYGTVDIVMAPAEPRPPVAEEIVHEVPEVVVAELPEFPEEAVLEVGAVAVAEYPEEEILAPEVPLVVEIDPAKVVVEEADMSDLNAPEIIEPVIGGKEPQVVELGDPELIIEEAELAQVDEPEIVEPEFGVKEPEVVELAEAVIEVVEEVEITELDEPELVEEIPDGPLEVVLEAAEAKPPVDDGEMGKIEKDGTEEETVVEVVEAVVENPPENLYLIEAPVVEQLEPGYHYIQVGVYGDESGASAAVSKLEREYPVLVWYPEQALDHFKVMIGPLLPDESGTLLYLFQNSGFGDAFIRKL